MRFTRTSLLLLSALLVLPGCVKRTITITSDPEGALVWLNDREIGRTPVDVEFVHYGAYDVRLVKDGYEPLLTSGKASPPFWDHVGLDLLAELNPSRPHADIRWHYEMIPSDQDEDALLSRARELRRQIDPEAPEDVEPVAGEEPSDQPASIPD